MRSLLTFAFLVVFQGHAYAAGWVLKKDTDAFTDKERTYATLTIGKTPEEKWITVRCGESNKLEVLFGFGGFLGTDSLRDVEYRFDKGDLTKEKWLESTDKDAVFADQPKEFARTIAKSNQLAIRVYDFEDTRHEAVFGLTDKSKSVSKVLRACNVDLTSIADSPELAGVSSKIRLEIADQWDERHTLFDKKVLTQLGFYKGEINSTKDIALFEAAQTYRDDLVKRCQSGDATSSEQTFCWGIVKGWTNADSYPVGAMIYSSASPELQEEAKNENL